MAAVSSDPHQWLLGFYAELRSHHAFATVRSLLAVATLTASLSVIGGVPIDAQSAPVRRYSNNGLAVDLPGDWQATPNSSRGDVTFRSATTGGEITFLVWLPLWARNYDVDAFEDFVTEWSFGGRGLRDVKRWKVSGFDAFSFSAREVLSYRGQGVTRVTRETWIGVPEPKTRLGTVFRFFFTGLEASGPEWETMLKAYEHMLASMRLDPVALHMY